MLSEDYIKEILYSQQITPLIIILVLGISFILGTIHAMGPGHGKSIMAAYLVGSRSRLRDVFLLAGSITISHVISVIAIGVIALFLMDFFWSEKANLWLSLASGMFIIAIGIWLLVKRFHVWKKSKPVQVRTKLEKNEELLDRNELASEILNSNMVSHQHGQDHTHSHAHNHNHSKNHHHYHYNTNISIWSNIWLGISAGLVPCPKALVILFLAISLQKITLGIIIIVVFSLGLASALVILGFILVKASYLLKDRFDDHRIQILPVFGSVIIIGLGLFLTIRTWQMF